MTGQVPHTVARERGTGSRRRADGEDLRLAASIRERDRGSVLLVAKPDSPSTGAGGIAVPCAQARLSRGSGHDSDGRRWDKFCQPSDEDPPVYDDSSRQQHDDVVGRFDLDIPAHRLGARRG